MHYFTILLSLQLVVCGYCASSSNSSQTGSQVPGDSKCDCFVTNGTEPAYFTNHMFFDFRSLPNYAGVPDVITDQTLVSSAPPSSDYFNNDNWTNIWEIQTWDNSYGKGKGLSNNGKIYMINSRSNVFIETNNDSDAVSETYMTLRTKRLPDFQTASEFQSVHANFQFVSMRMLARTTGAAGAVTGMFTYRDATGKLADVQESDVEILTRGPKNKVQYTNQPDYTDDGHDILEATINASTPDWSNWVVHRLDWTVDVVNWYANGQNVSHLHFQTPKEASDIHFSAWSDGGSWSGNMSTGGEVKQQIQWIEILYNTTDKNMVGGRSLGPLKRKDQGCKVVCSVDETGEAGKSTIVGESGTTVMMAQAGGFLMWVMLLLTGFTLI